MALAMTRLRVEHEHVVATIEAREAMAILGVKRENLYRKLKDTSKRLVGHMFTIESAPGKFEVFPLLDKATYEKGLLTIKFSSGITPYIHNLKTSFTTYELAVLVKFEYNYSYRLYELLKKEIYRVDMNETVVEKSYGLNELKCTIGLINMDERGVQDAVNRGKSWDEVYEIAKEKQKQNDEKRVTIMCRNHKQIFYLDEILYMESRAHRTMIHTYEVEEVCRDKISDIEQRMGDTFVRCHQSFLVNMKYIRRIENESFKLENGEEISISKRRYVETKNRYFAYLNRIEK